MCILLLCCCHGKLRNTLNSNKPCCAHQKARWQSPCMVSSLGLFPGAQNVIHAVQRTPSAINASGAVLGRAINQTAADVNRAWERSAAALGHHVQIGAAHVAGVTRGGTDWVQRKFTVRFLTSFTNGLPVRVLSFGIFAYASSVLPSVHRPWHILRCKSTDSPD